MTDAMSRRIAKAEAAKTPEQEAAEKRRLEEEKKRKGYDDEGDTTVAQAVPMA